MTRSSSSRPGTAQKVVLNADSEVCVVVQGNLCEGVVLRRSGASLQVESLLDGEPVVGWFDETAVYPVRASAIDERVPPRPSRRPTAGRDPQGGKPFEACLPRKDWYRSVVDEPPASVLIDGQLRPAHVLGRNGPRVQVRLTIEGQSYIRWLDAEALTADPGRASSD